MSTHRARKRFGQNFLHDQSVIDQIIIAINPQANEHLVEIGPGKGALTIPLLNITSAIDIIELDRDLIPLLNETCSSHGHAQVHNEDALQFNYCSLSQHDEKLRIVGNLPYNISTPLIFHLLSQTQCITDMHFMLQKEVVERLAANPGSKAYGRLSVMTQYHCQIENLFTVRPEAFHPVPKVESAIVRMTPYAKPERTANNYAVFADIVKQSFAMRRKTLRNNLKEILDTEQIQSVGVDPAQRAETLSLDDFVRLSNLLQPG